MNVITKYPVLLIAVTLVALGMVVYLATAQFFNPNNSFSPIDVRDGGGLYKKQLSYGNEAYLQIIDVPKMQIDQLIGETERIGSGQGLYYQGENQYCSPFFKKKLFAEVAEQYTKDYKDRVFSVINCSFFEQYQPATQLSFPVKLNGQVITGGNSPYGPIARPKDPRYKKVCLKALVWSDRQVYVTDYDPQTGKPLSEKDGTGGDELLAIITVNKATLEESANLLRELGAKGDIITIDGGTSTYLFNSKVGNIMLPQSSDAVTRELPHYLGFRSR